MYVQGFNPSLLLVIVDINHTVTCLSCQTKKVRPLDKRYPGHVTARYSLDIWSMRLWVRPENWENERILDSYISEELLFAALRIYSYCTCFYNMRLVCLSVCLVCVRREFQYSSLNSSGYRKPSFFQTLRVAIFVIEPSNPIQSIQTRSYKRTNKVSGNK